MKWLKKWLTKWLLDKEVSEFMEMQVQLMEILNHQMATFIEQQEEMAKLIHAIAENSNPEGWIPFAHNAIVGLDRRADMLTNTVQQHEMNFQKIFSVENGVEVIDLSGERPN